MRLDRMALLDALSYGLIFAAVALRVNRLESEVMALRVMAAAAHVHDDDTGDTGDSDSDPSP